MQPFHYSHHNPLFDHSPPFCVVASSGLRIPVERGHTKGLLAHLLRHPYRSYMIALAVAIALSAANVWAQDALPVAQQQGDIMYISGGIGSDESDALEAVKTDYSLQVTSADITGHFRGDTRIIVSNAAQTVLLDTVSQGPLLYAKLPKGRYTVYGYSEGQNKTQKVNIVPGKVSRVHFSWAQNVADISNDASLRQDNHLSHDSY